MFSFYLCSRKSMYSVREVCNDIALLSRAYVLLRFNSLETEILRNNVRMTFKCKFCTHSTLYSYTQFGGFSVCFLWFWDTWKWLLPTERELCPTDSKSKACDRLLAAAQIIPHCWEDGSHHHRPRCDILRVKFFSLNFYFENFSRTEKWSKLQWTPTSFIQT